MIEVKINIFLGVYQKVLKQVPSNLLSSQKSLFLVYLSRKIIEKTATIYILYENFADFSFSLWCI